MADIDLSADELTVLMEMTDEVAYTAHYLSEDLNYQKPDESNWTPKRVRDIQHQLKDKDYASLVYLVDEDSNALKGRGYILTRKGCVIRYRNK